MNKFLQTCKMCLRPRYLIPLLIGIVALIIIAPKIGIVSLIAFSPLLLWNLDDMSALIRTEKAKALHPIRRIFWTKETNEQIKKWLDRRNHLEKSFSKFEPDALFISVTGVKCGRRLKRNGIGEMLRRYSHLAGFEVICNPHSFRHHYGRDLAEKGANNSVISSLMGHAHIESSQVYTVLTSKMMEEQYDKFKRKE